MTDLFLLIDILYSTTYTQIVHVMDISDKITDETCFSHWECFEQS